METRTTEPDTRVEHVRSHDVAHDRHLHNRLHDRRSYLYRCSYFHRWRTNFNHRFAVGTPVLARNVARKRLIPEIPAMSRRAEVGLAAELFIPAALGPEGLVLT